MRLLVLLLSLNSSICLAKANFPFSLPEMKSGTMFSSEEHPNNVYVIEAYFLGCHYCNENATNVDRLAARTLGNTRVLVADVGVDRSDSQYREWLGRHQFQANHLVLKDASRSLLTGELMTGSFPTTYVLQCDGTVVYRSVGVWGSTSRMKIEQAVLKALEKECK